MLADDAPAYVLVCITCFVYTCTYYACLHKSWDRGLFRLAIERERERQRERESHVHIMYVCTWDRGFV